MCGSLFTNAHDHGSVGRLKPNFLTFQPFEVEQKLFDHENFD